MKVQQKTKPFRSKILATILTTALLLTIFPFARQANGDDLYGDVPTVVVGRILTPDLTGDSSNWVEIAQSGDYSLIVRANYINRAYQYGNSTWQYLVYGASNNYINSNVRDRINTWFNGLVPTINTPNYSNGDEVLPADARLRDFTVQHNATAVLGTSYTETTLTDGLSRPGNFRVGVGNDIAFALSSSETANFLSTSRVFRGGTAAQGTSPAEAATNFAKITIPKASGYTTGMWLRSVGSSSSTVGALYSDGFSQMFTAVSQPAAQRGYVFPALWVHQDIFETVVIGPGNAMIGDLTVVDGRILVPELSGDICDWVEIAQSGDYSLIVRSEFLNLQSFNYGDPIWQSARWQTPRDGTKNVGYTKDNVSHVINCWFNFLEVIPSADGINTYYDVLPADARLRQFTMQHNALSTLGTRYTSTTLIDGLSMPTKYQVGIGDNIAFCLSYSEAANYLSITRNFPGANTETYVSPPEAAANFAKVNIPKSSLGYYYAMWLRTPGNNASTQSALLDTGYVHELDVLNSQAGNLPNGYAFGYGLIYPALWVNSDIFYNKGTINIKYLDAATLEPLEDEESLEILAGNYGRIEPKDIRFYHPGVPSPDSDSVEGVLAIREEKNIVFLYTRGQVGVVVSHIDLVNYSTLGMDPYTIPAGEYGPYEPLVIPGYGKGELIPGSAPASGVLDIGEVAYIYYGYQKETRTVNVIYQSVDGVTLYAEIFSVPLGHYGEYLPYLFAGYKPGVWDDTSDPPEGVITEDDTIITIVYLYEPL